MGNQLGIQNWGLGIDPLLQKMKSFFVCLIVSDVYYQAFLSASWRTVKNYKQKPIQQCIDS